MVDGTETVTRLRGGRTQFGGDPTADVEVTISGCLFDPGGPRGETRDRGDTVTAQPAVYAPVGVDIKATDRLRVRGVVYAVDGQPAEWRSPFPGGPEGVHVALKYVAG